MELIELLHKRVLVAEKDTYYNQSSKTVKEIKILEISPSGNWVKIMNDVGKKYWLHYSDITPIEVLSILDPKPTNEANGTFSNYWVKKIENAKTPEL